MVMFKLFAYLYLATAIFVLFSFLAVSHWGLSPQPAVILAGVLSVALPVAIYNDHTGLLALFGMKRSR